jgi:class 3 adenylate cyclase
VAGAPAGTVTFAFSDVEGSTRLWQEHPDHMGAALASHDEVVRKLVDAHRGYVFSTGGDSFGVASETAGQAARWAGAVHAELATRHWPGGVGLRVRIGMHSGVAEERGGDYFGPAVNLAARISTLGHGGQTLVSAATAALVDDECVELGTYRVKGHRCTPGRVPGGRGQVPAVADRRRPASEPAQAELERLLAGHDEIEGVARVNQAWDNLRTAGAAALFMNVAGRLELFEPLARVHRWLTSNDVSRQYMPFAGDATELLEAHRDTGCELGAGGETMTLREVAEYMVGVLDDVVDDAQPG